MCRWTGARPFGASWTPPCPAGPAAPSPSTWRRWRCTTCCTAGSGGASLALGAVGSAAAVHLPQVANDGFQSAVEELAVVQQHNLAPVQLPGQAVDGLLGHLDAGAADEDVFPRGPDKGRQPTAGDAPISAVVFHPAATAQGLDPIAAGLAGFWPGGVGWRFLRPGRGRG